MDWTTSRELAEPAVATIQRLLRGDMTEAVLDVVLDELRADPAWIVLEPFDRPPERIIQMVYQPTRTPYAFHAVPVAPDRWHFVD